MQSLFDYRGSEGIDHAPETIRRVWVRLKVGLQHSSWYSNKYAIIPLPARMASRQVTAAPIILWVAILTFVSCDILLAPLLLLATASGSARAVILFNYHFSILAPV